MPFSQQLITSLTQQGTDGLFVRKRLTATLIKGDEPDFSLIIQDGTQMSVIQKSKGVDFLVGILCIIINDFCKTFNIKNNMSPEQIADLAIELVGECWSYKLEDFVAFFALAKKGRYGKIYDRIDAPTIFQMLGEYNIDRGNGIYNHHLNYTQTEKSSRPKPIGENNKLTTLGGAMGELKQTLAKNAEQIKRLDPNK